MIGSKNFDISHDDFQKGMNTVDDLNDGGYSSLSTNVSPIIRPGWITLRGNVTNSTSTLAGRIVATSDNGKITGTAYAAVDSLGNYYSIDLSTQAVTLMQTDSTGDYTQSGGAYDIVPYAQTAGSYPGDGRQLWATSNNNVVRWNGTNSAGTTYFDPTWWTVTKGKSALNTGVRHPLLVWNNLLYIADYNQIHSYNGATDSIVTGLLTLNNENYITALGVDPGSGKMLVGIATGSTAANNFSSNNTGFAYVGIYDGFNPTQFIKKVVVDEQIDSFYTVAGVCYVTYGQNLGIWTGSGIRFLRKLNIDLDKDQVVCKPKIDNIGRTLLIAEQTKILAYGEVIGNKDKVFFYPYEGTYNIDAIFNPVGTILDVCCYNGSSKGQIDYFDITTAGNSGTGNFYSFSYHMPRPVNIGQVNVYLNDQLASGSVTIYLIDDFGNEKTIGSITSADQKNKFFGFNAKTSTIQIRVKIVDTDVPLERIIITYDIAE